MKTIIYSSYPTGKNHRQAEQGFTLVELAIVLVIIGLIVGGVLVGQDLINAAEVRATVQQIEKYNSAVNTFRTRFNSLPGDILTPAAPLAAGLAGTALGQGDGNRILESDGGGIADMNGEITMFWQHLSNAQLVDGSYDGLQTVATLGGSFPRGKIDRAGVGVYGTGGVNFYQLGAISSTAAAAIYADGLTPQEARNIDVKVDDGAPFTGQTVGRGGATPNQDYVVAAATAATTCALGDDATPDSADTYDTGNTGVVCQLRFRMN